MRGTSPAHRSSVLRGQESIFGSRSDPENKLVDSTSHAHSGLRAVKYNSVELKHVEHFEDDDDNDNDSDDVEDVSVHGSLITGRYPRRQAISSLRVDSVFLSRRCLGSS